MKFYSTRNVIAKRVWWRLFSQVGKCNSAGLAAFLFNKALDRNANKSTNEKSIRLLLLSKESFAEDAWSSFGNDPRFEILSIDMMRIKAFKAMASAFLPPEIDDCNYLSQQTSFINGKAAYRKFLREFWERLVRNIRIDAVLTANFAYYAERELAAVLEELGVPFIVLHKENMKTPGLVKFFRDLYVNRRGPFLGRKILVYQGIERDLQIDAGITDPDRIIVTGMPRLDRLHEWRKEAAQRPKEKCDYNKQVLFFSFDSKTGLPVLPRKPRSGLKHGFETLGHGLDGLQLNQLARQSFKAVLRLAMENPDIKVIIKGKERLRKSAFLSDVIEESFQWPANIDIVVGGDPLDLIMKSDVICGFNTTALFEAIAAGKAVVVPGFAEAIHDDIRPYVVDLEDSVDYADSPEALVELLKKFASQPLNPTSLLPDNRARILEKWVGNADGHSCKRVREAVLKEINIH